MVWTVLQGKDKPLFSSQNHVPLVSQQTLCLGHSLGRHGMIIGFTQDAEVEGHTVSQEIVPAHGNLWQGKPDGAVINFFESRWPITIRSTRRCAATQGQSISTAQEACCGLAQAVAI